MKIAHTFKATVSHPVFNNSYFGHVVAPPRPVDVYILCVVSSIVHIAMGIEADDHFKTKMRQPIGNVSLQKGQSGFDTGRLIAVRASSQQDSWHVVAQRPAHQYNRIASDFRKRVQLAIGTQCSIYALHKLSVVASSAHREKNTSASSCGS